MNHSLLQVKRSRLARLFGVGFVILFLLSGCGGSTINQATVTPGIPTSNPVTVTPSSPTGQIKHIVFFIKENRTFDDYFGTYPGANGATTATDSSGQVVPWRHQADQVPDIDHSSEGARMAWDNGKMDKFDQLHSKGTNGAAAPYANNSLTQLYQSNIPDYWNYAQNFVLGDNMFSSLMGPGSRTISIRSQRNRMVLSITRRPIKTLGL